MLFYAYIASLVLSSADILFIKSNNQMAMWCETYEGYKMREMVYSQNLKIGNLEVDGILMLNCFIKKCGL
jgi:hypothetical protein